MTITRKPCRVLSLPRGHESIRFESFDLCTLRLMAQDTFTSCILAPDSPSIDLMQWCRLFDDRLFPQCRSCFWDLVENRPKQICRLVAMLIEIMFTMLRRHYLALFELYDNPVPCIKLASLLNTRKWLELSSKCLRRLPLGSSSFTFLT